jgi:Helix-turn-helix domain
MSIEAMSWALREAKGVPPHAVATLIGLANHADHEGRGAYPTQRLLAQYARKDVRQIRRHLADLKAAGLIRPGDERLVAHLPADRRPQVWNLVLDQSEQPEPDSDDRTPTTGREGPGGHERPDVEDHPDTHDRSWKAERPDADVLQTVLEPSQDKDSLRSSSSTPSTAVDNKSRRKADSSPRGTRIPEPFTLTDEMRAWGEANFPDLDGAAITEAFVDYWRAVPGVKGRKSDWPATWRNWVRREAERRPGSGGASAGPRGPHRPDQEPDFFARAMARAQAREQAEAS